LFLRILCADSGDIDFASITSADVTRLVYSFISMLMI
jgi:hypothetical protein